MTVIIKIFSAWGESKLLKGSVQKESKLGSSREQGGTCFLQCSACACACACELRTKTAAMCLGNIIGTYGSQSIQNDWDEGW